MAALANVFVGFVIVSHIYFLILEMFLWDKPFGLRTFGHRPEAAAASKSLAANQGLYNGFLAAGLVWGLVAGDNATSIKVFFLICIIVAGMFGGLTGNRKILLIQAIPAAVTLALVVVH